MSALTTNDIFTTIATVAAVVGLCLSFYNMYRQRWLERPQLKITLDTSLFPTMTPPSLTLSLKAVNIGLRPVTLQPPSLILPDGARFVNLYPMSDRSFPATLTDGQSCTAAVCVEKIAREMLARGGVVECEIACEFRDQAGNSYKSKPVKFHPEHALKTATAFAEGR